MAEYRKESHTVYDIKYHFVWITKYRYPVLRGEVALRARELLRQGGFLILFQILNTVRKNKNCGEYMIKH